MRVSIVALPMHRIEHNWKQWVNQPILISRKIKGSWYFNGPNMNEVAEKGFGFYAGGVVIGSVGVLKKGDSQLKIGGICKLAVDPIFRRNGVASELMKVADTYLKLNSFHLGALWKGHGVTPGFYEGFGYSSLNGSDIMVMELEGTRDSGSIMEAIRKEGVW